LEKGDKALRGEYEPILFHDFPAVDYDRELHWRAQGHWGRGTIKIGQEDLSLEVLKEHGKQTVPATEPVYVFCMEVKFT
jgi:hypothetical protein